MILFRFSLTVFKLSKKSPKELLDKNLPLLPIPDLNSYKKLYLERQPMKSSLRACGISPVIFDFPSEESNYSLSREDDTVKEKE